MALRGKDLLQPLAPGTRFWTLLVRAAELELPTKTGSFDDSLLWDGPRLLWLQKFFPVWQRAGEGTIWNFTYAQYARRFAMAAERLGLTAVVPYSLRHSGASLDALDRSRTLQEIQKRGRWRAHRSLVRYEKAGRIYAEYNRLPAATRAWLEMVAVRLEAVMQDPNCVSRPP